MYGHNKNKIAFTRTLLACGALFGGVAFANPPSQDKAREAYMKACAVTTTYNADTQGSLSFIGGGTPVNSDGIHGPLVFDTDKTPLWILKPSAKEICDATSNIASYRRTAEALDSFVKILGTSIISHSDRKNIKNEYTFSEEAIRFRDKIFKNIKENNGAVLVSFTYDSKTPPTDPRELSQCDLLPAYKDFVSAIQNAAGNSHRELVTKAKTDSIIDAKLKAVEHEKLVGNDLSEVEKALEEYISLLLDEAKGGAPKANPSEMKKIVEFQVTLTYCVSALALSSTGMEQAESFMKVCDEFQNDKLKFVAGDELVFSDAGDAGGIYKLVSKKGLLPYFSAMKGPCKGWKAALDLLHEKYNHSNMMHCAQAISDMSQSLGITDTAAIGLIQKIGQRPECMSFEEFLKVIGAIPVDGAKADGAKADGANADGDDKKKAADNTETATKGLSTEAKCAIGGVGFTSAIALILVVFELVYPETLRNLFR